MSAAERQAARRRRQNEAEAKLAQLQDDIKKILGLTERLYASMYHAAGLDFRIDQNWSHLLKAVHEAAYAAIPDLTPENLAFAFPMAAKRASPMHNF
jgi:predicted nuclease with TOPRIM domain